MSFGRRHRRDGNHRAICERFEQLGCKVLDLSQVGRGCPDISVGICGVNYFVEIKELGKGLTAEQYKWHDEWTGERPTVIWGVDQCDAFVNNMRKRVISGN